MSDGNRRRSVVRGLAAVVLAAGLGGAVFGLGSIRGTFTADDVTWTQKSWTRTHTTPARPAPSTTQVQALDVTWT